MAGMIFGVYETHQEVLDAIHRLKDRGFKNKDITVLADKKERLKLEKKEKVKISVQEEKEDYVFLKALQNIFSLNKKEDVISILISLHLAKEDIDVYLEQISNGKIIVILDPEETDEPPSPSSSEKREPLMKSPLNQLDWSLYDKNQKL